MTSIQLTGDSNVDVALKEVIGELLNLVTVDF